MKNRIIKVLLFFTLILSFSLISNNTSANENKTIYLVTEKDITINNEQGKAIEKAKLSNAFIYEGKIGDELPTPDSLNHLEFLGWGYAKDTQLKVTTVVIEVDVLYAQFKSKEDLSKGAIPLLKTRADLYIVELTSNELLKENNMFINHNSYNPDVVEYMIEGFEVSKNYSFTLKSKAGLMNHGGINSYPTTASGKSDGIGYTLGSNALSYIEVINMTTNGNTDDGGLWTNIANDNSQGLRFKEGGTFNIYLIIHDNGGWVEIYIDKVR